VRGELAGALEADPGFLHGAAMQKALHDLMLSPGRTDDLSAWLASTTAAALAAELRAQTTMRDLSADLADLATRIYLRVGALDLACPPACSEAILRSAPRASLELVDGAGHALLTEDLTATTAAIERELARR
ncbi:MAG: hypothetical protein ABI591_15480, partial [Kofleriaceae bacterium]